MINNRPFSRHASRESERPCYKFCSRTFRPQATNLVSHYMVSCLYLNIVPISDSLLHRQSKTYMQGRQRKKHVSFLLLTLLVTVHMAWFVPVLIVAQYCLMQVFLAPTAYIISSLHCDCVYYIMYKKHNCK